MNDLLDPLHLRLSRALRGRSSCLQAVAPVSGLAIRALAAIGLDKRLFSTFLPLFHLTTDIVQAEYCPARSRLCDVNANGTGQGIASFDVYAFGPEKH